MIPAIERSTVGGLTVLRAGSPAGRNAAGLVFRVGRFDFGFDGNRPRLGGPVTLDRCCPEENP